MSTRELLAAAPEIRRHVKDLVTNRRIPTANIVEINDPANTFHTVSPSDTPSSVLIDIAKYDQSTADVKTSLRVIYPDFGSGIRPECILDTGSEIVVMRRDVWKKLRGVDIRPARNMSMETANSSRTSTIGLIVDHPVSLGPITVYLQIQVVLDAPFEVLLGRPFYDVLSGKDVSFKGGEHELHAINPDTGEPAIFATYQRPPPTNDRYPSGPAVNFRR